jgi:CelD/BcsL family acetyltransferase involved in cellulose biosynthesis
MFRHGAQRKIRTGEAAKARRAAPAGSTSRSGEVLILRPREGGRSDAVAVRIGEQAWNLLASPGFLLDWKDLEGACPWATPYQSADFTLTWLRHYRARFAPVVVTLRSRVGGLGGLLILALELGRERLVVAGAHQAEYQAWLATPEAHTEFIVRALTALDEVLPGHELKFRYLPPRLPVHDIMVLAPFDERARLEKRRRPLLRLGAAAIRDSLRKKSNKSRWARLQKLGPVVFRRIVEPEDFAAVFDEIIASYDARQWAMKGVLPFAQDPHKKAFHLDLMRARPELLHVTVTTLSGRVIAAHVGVTAKEEVHLSILCHSDMHASQSPGKLHLLHLGELLLREGRSVLDLTPGGDPWKERFANAHDDVYELTIFGSPAARRWRQLQLQARQMVKGLVGALGLSPARVRRTLLDFHRRWLRGGRPTP